MSARLSRKNACTGQAYHYVLQAAQLKDKSATIEHARLLWKDGHHRKAIQILKGAIAANAFMSHDYAPMETDSVSITLNREHQNMLAARVCQLKTELPFLFAFSCGIKHILIFPRRTYYWPNGQIGQDKLSQMSLSSDTVRLSSSTPGKGSRKEERKIRK
jgi:hypothetical protein